MGGKAFPNTIPIPANKVQDLLGLIKNLFGLSSINDLHRIGSSAYYQDNYNDLDVAFEIDDVYWDVFTKSLDSFNVKHKLITNHCLSIAVPANENAVHQVDIMRSQNIKYTWCAYYSDIGSNYKGAHRNILLNSFINEMTVEEHKATRTRNTDIRTKFYMDLYHGLSFLVQTKSPNTKRYTTLVSTPMYEPRNLKYLDCVARFDPRISWYNLKSFEHLYDFIEEHAVNKETIFQEAYMTINTCGLQMPKELIIWK